MTDTNGDFTVALPVSGPEQFTVYSSYGPVSPWFSAATASLPLSVVLPDTLSAVTASLTPADGVGLSACLNVNTPGSQYVNPISVLPDVPDVNFQYATSPDGPWTTLASPAATAPAASAVQECYSDTARARRTSAYYRAETDGSVSFQPATSPAAYASIDPTRIASFAAAPHRPTARQKVTISARLQRHTSGWQALARQQVQITFRAKGATRWTVLRTIRTDSGGHFTARLRIGRAGTLTARYLGDRSYLECAAGRVYLNPRR